MDQRLVMGGDEFEIREGDRPPFNGTLGMRLAMEVRRPIEAVAPQDRMGIERVEVSAQMRLASLAEPDAGRPVRRNERISARWGIEGIAGTKQRPDMGDRRSFLRGHSDRDERGS